MGLVNFLNSVHYYHLLGYNDKAKQEADTIPDIDKDFKDGMKAFYSAENMVYSSNSDHVISQFLASISHLSRAQYKISKKIVPPTLLRNVTINLKYNDKLKRFINNIKIWIYINLLQKYGTDYLAILNDHTSAIKKYRHNLLSHPTRDFKSFYIDRLKPNPIEKNGLDSTSLPNEPCNLEPKQKDYLLVIFYKTIVIMDFFDYLETLSKTEIDDYCKKYKKTKTSGILLLPILKDYLIRKAILIDLRELLSFFILLWGKGDDSIGTFPANNNFQIKKCHVVAAYYARAHIYLLLETRRKSINDIITAQNEIIIPEKRKSNKYYHMWKWFHITGFISKGDSYYAKFDFNRAFDAYCRGCREIEPEHKRIEYNSAFSGGSADINYTSNDIIMHSSRIIKTYIHKGKTFLELGEFRHSLKWFLKALADLIILDQLEPQCRFKDWMPILSASKITNKNNLFKMINGMVTFIIYLAEEQGKEKISKYEIREHLKNTFPDTFMGFLDKRNGSKYSKLYSDILCRIGYVIYILDPYGHFDNQINKSGINVGSLLLGYAYDINPSNALSYLDYILSLHRDYLRTADAETYSLLTPLLGNDPHFKSISRNFSLFSLKNQIQHNITTIAEGKELNIEDNLFFRLLTDLNNIITRPDEVYQYLNRKGRIKKEKEGEFGNTSDIPRFICLKRWNSFNPVVPRPRATMIKGGGYFLVWENRGIVIDPGFNYISNLYEQGFALEDIDVIILTHAHIDHTDELDALLTLIYEYHSYIKDINKNKKYKLELKKLDIFFNIGAGNKYFSWLYNNVPQNIANIHVLNPNNILDLKEYKMKIEVIKGSHKETGKSEDEFSVGLIFHLGDFKLGITGDTSYKVEEYKDEGGLGEKYQGCDILVAHIGDVSHKEMVKLSKIEVPYNILQKISIDDLSSIEKTDFAKRLGYDDEKDIAKSEKDNYKKPDYYRKGHLGFNGINSMYKRFTEHIDLNNTRKLMIISEFAEEIGSFRHVIAQKLNHDFNKEMSEKYPAARYPEDHMRTTSLFRCLTGDIGLHISLPKPGEPKHIGIQCNKCNQDNDIVYELSFHDCFKDNIREVCLKHSQEGIKYFCTDHFKDGPEEFFEVFEE